MRFTYNQYNYYESCYRIPSKMHHNNSLNNINNNNNNNNSSSNNNNSNNNGHNLNISSSNPASSVYHPHHYKSNFGMRTTMSTMSTMSPRIHRKGFRTPSKRHPGKAFPGKLHSVSRIGPGKMVPGKRFPIRPHPPPCDNSNDSGFGFDQHVEIQQQQPQQQQTSSPNSSTNLTSSSLHHHNHHSHHQQQSSIQHSLTSLSNSSNTSSSAISSSSSSSSSATSLQHSPQQHLIRAIPASRSRPAKKLSVLNDDTENTESGDEDFCTDDSDDNYGGRYCKNLKITTQQISSLSSSSSSSSSSPHSDKYHHHQNHNHYQMGHSIKRKKIETIPVDLDNDDACSEDAFIRKIASAASTNLPVENSSPAQLQVHAATHSQAVLIAPTTTKFIAASARGMTRVAHKRQPVTQPNSVATSSNGRIQLEILSQPEQQHRARYQTEGSRGAVKDRSGNGFPIVRLVGYNKATTLQVFIGTDIGRVAPHMFYQACKVAGKNSTQCNEKKVDGTVVIEIDFKPEQDMTVTCDCVGILKERNVDVEHRFPEHLAQKNKKKSTRCRMVFRTQLTHDDGTVETLQVCSNPIICTQPPGVPEICKKSLNSCPVDGGLELFIIGKNFLKDTHVIFQETFDNVNTNNEDDLKKAAATVNDMSIIGGALWEQTVLPDKEYLQQTHLICTVPPYIHQNIMKPVTVQVAIISSGKKSEPHTFVYTPKGTYTTLSAATTLSSSTNTLHNSLPSAQDGSFMDTTPATAVATASTALWPATETKLEIDADMMPPPITTQMPMVVRRPSLNTTQPLISDQQLVHLNSVVAAEALKTELLDESSQTSIADAIHSPENGAPGCNAVGGVTGPQSPTALQYHTRYGRKASMDAIMYENNSMQGFPVTPAAPATTSMEVAVAAAVEMAVKNEIAKAVSVAKVDKFITDLAKSANVADTTDPVQEPSLFGVTNAAAIDHALTDILTTPQTTAAAAAVAAAVVLERSLSNSSVSSSSTQGSPLSGTSPSNSLTNHNSPITQDIILNSEPSVQLTPALPLQQLVTSGSSSSVAPEVSQGAGLSTDIIMNPSVSPSTILCSDNGAATAVVPNIMAPHQVTMANSILNDIAMQAQPTQQDAAVAALALSNIIMTPPSDTTVAVPDAPTSMQPEVSTATSTAVSNMIIKAAADFISNHEQQTQHHHHCHTNHQSHTPQQQLMSSQNVTADPLACNPLNLLLNHTDVTLTTQPSVVNANNNGVNESVSTQFSSLGIATPPQESLIVALATENAIQKSVAAAAITTNGAVVTQETPAPPTPNLHPAAAAAVGAVAAAAAAAAVAPLAPIPQELTTMSDQDLLSYINPSTFDQV